jgi:large repetitive protein
MQKRMGTQIRGKGRAVVHRRQARLGLLLLVTALLLFTAAPAQATFHLIKVREVHPGSSDDSYVELQMYAAGQSLLSGHSMTLYDASGALSHSSTFSSTVPNSANQQTVLIGDTGVQTAFGVAPDLVDSGLVVSASGGAACWNAGGLPADCVAWGNFSGSAALQLATGTTVGSPVSPTGITAGRAIRRTIEPGCPTLLEESDDSDDSATDFSEVTPAPRNDASPISEHTCAGAPNTAIDDKPPLRSNSASAEFTYEAPTATSYECKLDTAVFSACPLGGPKEYTGLTDGSHSFQVRGVNASGPDPTPATYTWTVDTTPPLATIDTHPADPSPGATAQFTYHAPNEPGSSFKCSLDGALPSACPTSGMTYHGLADGEHSFSVEAIDGAGNQQLEPAEFSWTVDNTVIDKTPPETTIESRPPDPSESASASFTYASNEPGSSFECSLDGAPFTSCPPSGISYSGLGNGPHSFRVRATDPSNNTDQTPAGYSFAVVLSPPSSPVQSPQPSPLSIAPTVTTKSAAPNTTLFGKPAVKTHDRTPTFRFRSQSRGAGFQCQLDRGPYRACHSPVTVAPLKLGPHIFRVRAVSRDSHDSTPAAFAFKVLAR